MMDYRNNYNNENETNNENMMAAKQNSFNGKKPSSKNKKAAKLAKKIGAIALSAVLFGGVAGGTFQAVNHFAGSTTAAATTTTAQQTTSNSSLLKAAATSSSSTSTGTMDVSTIAKNDRLHHKPVRTGSTELLQHVRLRCPDSADRGDHKLRFRYHHRKE